MSRMSAGSEFEYLMRHAAHGDAPGRSTAMTHYYVNAGYPAAVWLGATSTTSTMSTKNSLREPFANGSPPTKAPNHPSTPCKNGSASERPLGYQ